MMRDGLKVAAAQWLPTPGDGVRNLATALDMIDHAAGSGVDLVVLPELWSMGYNPSTLAKDAQALAEALDGPLLQALATKAKERAIWVHAGTVPERDGSHIFNTATLFNRDGDLVATHRKFKPYPLTGEHLVFAAGSGITVYEDDELGRVGLVTCFDGDFRETQAALRQARVELVLEPAAYDIPGAPTWDLWYRANALASAQFWVMSGQCGINPSTSLLGASQIISPTGALLAKAPTCDGLTTPDPSLIFAELTITAEIRAALEYATLLDDPDLDAPAT